MKRTLMTCLIFASMTSFAYAQSAEGNSSSVSQAFGQSAGNITTFNSSNPQQAPGAIAPGLAAAGVETCIGSASGGFSGPGIGFSFGSTTLDEGCEARLDARTLYNMGQKNAAMYRLCDRPKIALFLAYAGTPCPPEFYNARQQKALFGPKQSRKGLPTLTLKQAKSLSIDNHIYVNGKRWQ